MKTTMAFGDLAHKSPQILIFNRYNGILGYNHEVLKEVIEESYDGSLSW